jgi:hypothetical protein
MRDTSLLIADAVSPGGSGDPFAGLSHLERSVLLEVTRMGVHCGRGRTTPTCSV